MPKNDEGLIQRAIIEHLRIRADKRVIYFSIPNSPRSKVAGGRLKAMGMLAGAPDLCFVLPDSTVCFLELKVGKNRLSEKQTDFAKRCKAIGVNCASAWGLDQALAIIEAWGVMPPLDI